MAREYAKIRTDIWSDEDWRCVSASEKLLYFVLLTHSTLSYVGVADWRPNRLAPLVDESWSEAEVRRVAELLEERHLIVTDDDTEEVLVRSFIKHDGVMKQPRLAVSMASAFAGVASQFLRQVIAHEVHKLREAEPDLACWSDARVRTVLDHSALDVKQFRQDLGKGLGSVSEAFGPNVGQGLVSPTTTATTTSSKEDIGAARKAPEKPIPDDWQPSQAHVEYARDNRLDLAHEAEQFRAHALANDRRQRNWNGAFSYWLGNAKKWGRVVEPQKTVRRFNDEVD